MTAVLYSVLWKRFKRVEFEDGSTKIAVVPEVRSRLSEEEKDKVVHDLTQQGIMASVSRYTVK